MSSWERLEIQFAKEDGGYLPLSGSFATLVKQEGRWVSGKSIFCRERFHRKFHTSRILFFHRAGKSMNVAAFIAKAEERLGLTHRSDFGLTQRANVMWIQVSPWWRASAMRRSLFTILLRAGQVYNPSTKNFSRALFSVNYAAETKMAVKHFFAGHTWYTGRASGWYDQFRWGGSKWRGTPPNKSEIEKLLVKPI